MKINLLFLSILLLSLSSCFTKMALDKYNTRNINEVINHVETIGYTKDSKLVVNFHGKYLGKKYKRNYHFILDANEIIKYYSKARDSIALLPFRFNANRIYSLNHDLYSGTPEILTLEINKEKVKKGKYKEKIFSLDGKTTLFSNGSDYSLDIYDKKNRKLIPQVIQFTPESPWLVRGKIYEDISFVLEPTYNKNELNLLYIPLGLVADIGFIWLQVWLNSTLNRNSNLNNNNNF